MAKDDDINKLQLIVLVIVAVAVIGAFLGIPIIITEGIIQWLVSMFVGAVMSLIAGEFVEAFTGDFLKTITLTVTILDFEMSISTFFVVTVVVKYWLFGSL